MAKKSDDDEFELTRPKLLLGLLFALWLLPDLSGGLDKRRRSTDAFRSFHRFARQGIVLAALLLARSYASAILDANGYSPESPALSWLLPATSGASLAWSWLQAQIGAYGLFKLYDKIARVTFADHGA